jgi:HEAT repeat protein
MSTLRTPLGVAALARTLSDPQPEVRIEAVRALGVIDDDTVPDVLLTALGDPEIRVREIVVQTLAGWRSPAVARRLAGALSVPDLRRPVAQVLERMGQAAVGPLVEVVMSADPTTAAAAGHVLGEISGPRAFVAELASTDPARRRRSVEVLGAMGGSDAVDGLISVLTDPDVQVRTRAASLLGERGDPRAVRPLKRVFTTDPVSEVAAAAEQALRRLGELPDSPAQELPDWPET